MAKKVFESRRDVGARAISNMPDTKVAQPPTPAPAVSYVSSRFFKIINLTICLIIVGIVFLTFHFKLLDKIELVTIDFRYKLRGIRKVSPEIVHIDIDESSISRIGRWPWSREWFASIITTLSEYKSKTIAFDMFFSEPSPLIDFFLIQSTRLANNVIYAIAFKYEKEAAEITPDQISALTRFKISESQIVGNKKNIPRLTSPIPPLPELYNVAKGAGFANAFPDPDGAIRRAPSVVECEGNYYLHFSLETLLAYLGIDPKSVKIILGKYIALGEGTKIPIDEKGFIIVNWAAPWGKASKHYSFWEVVMSYQKILNGEEPIIRLEEFKDKICLVGLTATGLIDIKPIPLEPAYPIVGIHSNVIDSVLQKKFIQEVKPPVNLTIILLLTMVIGIIIPRFRPIGGTICAILIVIIYIVISYLIFKFTGLLINVTYPLTSVLIGFIAVMIHSEVANALERARLFHMAIEDGLTKLFVVRHFKEILEQEMAKAKRYKRPLSIIISDIDHFKRVNDTYGHLAGDFILKEIANIFKSSCREFDIPGRYGGEEFIILLPETNRDGAIEFAERLRKLIEGLTLEYNNIKFNITISFGVAELKDDAAIADFIKRADEALYVAKETGRNKVCFG